MALQLTPTSGTTAAPDRMGDYHAELVQQGRIVQGHNVSGPLSPEMDGRIDRDLKDREWREIFHFAVRNDVRFQRGLVPEDTVLTPWLRASWTEWPVTLAEVRQMSRLKLDPERAIALEYGLMRSEEHTSELQSPCNLVCRLLLEKKKNLNPMTMCEIV